MTIAERAARDRASITSNTWDRAAVTLTDPAGPTVYTIYGDVYRTDMQVDPETGARIHEPRTTIVYSYREFAAPIAEGWTVSAPDGAGSTVTGEVVSIERNQTHGTVTFHVEVSGG